MSTFLDVLFIYYKYYVLMNVITSCCISDHKAKRY